MMGNLHVDAAQKKLVSLLYLSVGSRGRKTLMDKFPHKQNITIPLRDIMQKCEECFRVIRNKTLDRQTFLSRKQNKNKSLHQFWNILNELAAKCDFGDQREGLVHDIFFEHGKKTSPGEALY